MSSSVFSNQVIYHHTVSNAPSIAGYHLISEYVRQHRQVFIVTETSLDALLLAEYIKKYRQDCYVFSDHELMPYDNFPISGYLGGQRNAAVYKILTADSWVVVSSVSAATYKIPPKSFYLNECAQLSIGQKLDIENFEQTLACCGFECVSEVSDVADVTDVKSHELRIDDRMVQRPK